MKELAAQFRNPGAAYRGKPFWSWNGDLKEEELIRQVHVMKEMGLGGFFMHSRTGLITEYLGDEWFRLTNACADEAEKLGMEAWLYDEDRWPSGTAGGMVTAHPEHRMQYMSLRPLAGSDFAWSDGVIAAFACDLDGYSCFDARRLTISSPPSSYTERTVLVFEIEPMASSSFYNGNTYVDTLSRSATDRFIELTHERYRERCGDRIGKSIRGIFTDEPHRGAVFSGFGLPNESRLWMTPWTTDFAERYREAFGEDIVDRLPELFLIPDGNPVSPVKWRYMELLQRMFLSNFAKPLYDWCEDNGMLLTGHVLHEDTLTCQVGMQGSLMRFYEYMHYPGVDVLTEGNRNYVIVKQLTSVARQLGQKWLLSELYGCTGWQMNFQSHKEVGDWQALLGINLRCHHLSWYTMEGEAKRDFPGSILHQSAWWKDYDYVEAYFARLGLILNQGRPACDLLVINPVESLWSQVHVGWAEGLSPLTPAVQEIEKKYADLSAWLMESQLDFDYADEEMLGRLNAIGTDADGHAVLHVGQAAYRAVVVGHMTSMRGSTLAILDAFHRAGGDVIFAGAAPEYLDALPSVAPAELSARASALPWDRDAIVNACKDASKLRAEIVCPDTGDSLADVFCQLRTEGDLRYLVALNITPLREYPQTLVRIPGHGLVEEWDCRSGKRHAIPSRKVNGYTEVETSFAPSCERVFVLTPVRDDDVYAAKPMVAAGRQMCEGPFSYRLSEENVCVLDFARFSLDGEALSDRAEILKVDQAIRARLGLEPRGGEMVQPWFHRKFHESPSVLAHLALEFDFDVEVLPETPLTLCVERPETWRIFVNDAPLDESPDGWWIDAAFERIPLPTGCLRTGTNRIRLESGFHEGTNLEALHLIGDFGVRIDGDRCALTERPLCLRVGDLTAQGLPFYGGSLIYHVPLKDVPPSGRIEVETPRFEAACIKVREPVGPDSVIAFPPFTADISERSGTGDAVEIEVVLTRRNTFGPLHQVPLRAGAYGPGNFTTGGENFSPAYMLYPAGLLAEPVVTWFEAPPAGDDSAE